MLKLHNIYTGARCLGELLKVNHSLKKLDIRSNTIGDEGISLVADGLQHNNKLIKLNVSACQLSSKGTFTITCSYVHS